MKFPTHDTHVCCQWEPCQNWGEHSGVRAATSFVIFVWLFGLDSKPSFLLWIKQNRSWSCNVPGTSISSKASGAHTSSLQVTAWHDPKFYLSEFKNTLGTLSLVPGKVRSHPYPAWFLFFKDVAFLILNISHGTGITLGVLEFCRTENSYPFC